jgi:hypothetical protein
MMISIDELKALLTYSYSTGEFVWRKNGERAGTTRPDGRVSIMIRYRAYRAHRLAWMYVNGSMPTLDIDHIDGNPANNAIANLREVTRSVNMQNQRRARSDNSTGMLGVQNRGTGKFRAEIALAGKRIYLGTFTDPVAAADAYLKAKRAYHEGCTL